MTFVRRALILGVLVLTSCGGNATAPSPPAPQLTGSLNSGSYLLMVTMATSGTSGFSSCVSLTIGGAPAFVSVSAPTPVRVERTGNSVTIAPDDPSATFRMQLQMNGATLSGTASGQYRTSATPVAVSGMSSSTAAVTGIVGQTFTSGALDGSVSVGDMTCTNNGHGWSLMPR